MERFILSLKMERIWLRVSCVGVVATRDITDYIVGFYNSTRLHLKQGYRPPSVFERESVDKTPILVSGKI